MMYYLLASEHPFDSLIDQEDGNIRKENQYISECAFDLISNLLKVEIEDRYTAQQALDHPFFLPMSHEKMHVCSLVSDIEEEIQVADSITSNDIAQPNESKVTCSACKKKFDREKEGVFVLPDMFFCGEDFDRFQKRILPKEIMDEYNIKYAKNSIIELFTPIIVDNNIDISKCSPEEVFIDSEMISKARLISKYYKYFVPTVTFHIPI